MNATKKSDKNKNRMSAIKTKTSVEKVGQEHEQTVFVSEYIAHKSLQPMGALSQKH